MLNKYQTFNFEYLSGDILTYLSSFFAMSGIKINIQTIRETYNLQNLNKINSAFDEYASPLSKTIYIHMIIFETPMLFIAAF